MNKIVLVNKPAFAGYQMPYLWATAKTYYEESSLYKDRWDWGDPVIVIDDAIKKTEEIINLKPTIVGFSLYVWNEVTFNNMAEAIKKKLPNTLILFGGPQCDIKHNPEYFRQRPYVDLVVPGDAYGEIILLKLLDGVINNNGNLHTESIPYCYYPIGDNRDVKHNDIPLDKKNFNWTNNAFRAQQAYFDRYKKENVDPSVNGTFMLETSRGCPYRCSFCDWGGGTYTKTIKKPFATVMDEIRWIGENQFRAVYITDANFGLFDIDIEYAKQLAKMKEEYGYPKLVTIQNTKTKMKNLEKIYEILCDSKQLPHLKIAVEDLNDHVIKNIDRVDFPFEEKMEMINRLLEKFPGMSVFIEGILGLPGSSLEWVIKDIDRTVKHGIDYPFFHPWVLLPETPAYDPEYRKKFKIKTIKDKGGLGVSGSIPLQIKQGYEVRSNVTTNVSDENNTSEYVVATYSYDQQEFVDMFTLQSYVMVLHNTGVLKHLGKFVRDQHNYEWGDFYLETQILLENHPTLGQEFKKVKQQVNKWINSDATNLFIDFKDDFKYLIHANHYILFTALSNPSVFFDSLGQHFTEKFNDDRILDLINYIKASTIHIDYRACQQHQFDHNWYEYTNETEELVKRPSLYQINDSTIRVGSSIEEIDWDQYKGTPDHLTHFFYRVCYHLMARKTALEIKPI